MFVPATERAVVVACSNVWLTSVWSGASGDETVIGVPQGRGPGTQRKMPCFWLRPKS